MKGYGFEGKGDGARLVPTVNHASDEPEFDEDALTSVSERQLLVTYLFGKILKGGRADAAAADAYLAELEAKEGGKPWDMKKIAKKWRVTIPTAYRHKAKLGKKLDRELENRQQS